MVTWLRAQQPAECNCSSHILLWVWLQFVPYLLPDVDTDLSQLAIPATILCFKPWLPCMSIVHLLLTYTHDHLHQWSLKLSVANCLRVLMHHMMNWIAAGRSGILIINSTKIMKGNQRLLFLMQVHINKPKACSVSCSIVIGRHFWNWKNSKISTNEALWSSSCCNCRLECFLATSS